MGELSYSDDDDWVLVWFCRFGTESLLGAFFFVFFDKHSILLLPFVCFDFAL